MLLVVGTAGWASDGTTKDVTILPFGVGSDLTPEQSAGAARCASGLAEAVSEGMASVPGVTVVEFSRLNPSIQRAIVERKIAKEDVDKGVDTSSTGAALARKIARIMGVEVAVIGSVDRYEFNETKGLVTVTVTLQSIDAKSGKAVSTVSASGQGSKPDGGTAGEESLSDSAMKDVLAKVMNGLQDTGGAPSRSAH